MKRRTAPEEKEIALFCSNLRMAMHQRRMSQKEVAALSGLTESQVSRYMKGRCEPGLRTICRLAEALGISPAFFLCPAAERYILTSPCWKGEAVCNTILKGEHDEQI